MNQTIKVSNLTLGDWLAIAESAGFRPTWGLNRWEENGDTSVLTQDDWLNVADMMGYSQSWGFYKFMEHRHAA